MNFTSILTFLLILQSGADTKHFQIPSYGLGLARVLIEYTINMMPISPVVNFMQVSHPNNTIDQLYIMNEVLYHASKKEGIFRVILDIKILNAFSDQLNNRKRFNTIVLVDSVESFYDFFDQINLEHWEYSGRIVVAITKHQQNIYECMTKIFEAFWSKKIVNVVVIFSPHANTFEVMLYTYYPFSAFYCERALPVLLNHYRGKDFLSPINFFPEKLGNFYGCPVSVVTFKNPPFMMFEVDENGLVNVDGIDGTVLRVLAQQLNFNVNIFDYPERQGRIYENGTVTGAMGYVHKNKINMTIGFFASVSNREKFLKSSYVYYTTNLIWMVPPGKPQSPLKKLSNPLDKIIWIVFGIILLVGFTVIALIKLSPRELQNFVFGSKTSSPGMNMVNIVLGNSLHQLPFRNFARFLFLIFTYFCFILRTSYQGNLVKFIQMDTREPKITGTNELIDNNFPLYYVDSATAYFSELPIVKEHGKILSYSEYNKNVFNLLNPNFKGAFLTTESHLAYRNKMAFPRYINYGPNSLFTVNLVIYMQRGTCMGNVIDSVLINLVSSGLINKWASSWIDKKYMKEPPQKKIQILNFHQLQGAFDLLVFGLAAAFFVFFIEIIFYNFKGFLKLFKKY